MSEPPKLTRPWLVAVWPGMGHVAISAGFYLMAKLDMRLLAEMSAQELFDIDHVEVKQGLIQKGMLPHNRLFVWSDPQRRHDLVLFIGEAQPPLGKYHFCQRLIESAKELGVERVFTSAAMATPMPPTQRARVFCTATDEHLLEELQAHHLEVLTEGNISGLNGVLLAVAAEAEIPGACLLGEMPHVFHQLPFPKASLAVLLAFTEIANVEVDLDELSDQAKAMTQQLDEIYQQVRRSVQEQEEEGASKEFGGAAPEEERLAPADKEHIEQLFEASRRDRSKAYELKQRLDRLGVFKEYEDRFLDLFKRPD